MLSEVLVAIITIVCLLLWDYLNKKRRINILRNINGFKGPSMLPFIGAGHHFAKYTPETTYKMFNDFTNKYGNTWSVCILHEVEIFTADIKLIEAVMSSQQVIMKSQLYSLLKGWLGTGLLLSTGKKWFTRRKIITPTFHFKILEQFVDVFDQQSAVMAQKLYAKADGKTAINIFPVVCLTALDIIAETAMGVKVNAQKDPHFPYVESVRNASDLSSVRFIQPAQRFDFTMRLAAPSAYAKLQKHIAAMHDFTDKVIAERRDALEKSIADGTYKAEQESDIGAKKRVAFLDVLLQSTVGGSPLSNEDIREEVDTFMFEGHDTTTSGISHILYLIARHPEEQQKLFEEICQVIGDDKDRPITMRDLQELKYLECAIKEGLRLYPPVPVIGRHVEQDTELNGQLIPANTNITILLFRVLRDPAHFTDPDSFKPERFNGDSTEKINPFAYAPFSAGPRNCVGQKFAMLEMKSTISKMLRHFELLPLGEEVQPLMNIVLRSKNGVHLGLKPRTY